SIGALFGLVFAYSRYILPGQNHVKKALVLAGIMWFTLYFLPFLKYPANPPTVGDPETIILRTSLYIGFVALSGLGAIGFYKISKRIQKSQRFIIPIVYAIYITAVFMLMPESPDEVIAPVDLLNGFRIVSASTVTIYWIVNAIILGLLWQKFQPHLERHQEIN
ncbi:MAG TPA: CbtA family protein, partial [Nitrosopumilaceae archaeon]|nr:CbtA family protein [Nitrosopumilaceae archaeon]